jgi:molecular chaperone GrpE
MENKKEEKIAKRLFEITTKTVVLDEKNRVLILKRSAKDHRFPGKNDLPGGSIEDGEDIKKSIEREIREETGLKVEVGPVIHVCDFEKDYRLDQEDESSVRINGKGLRFIAYKKEGEVELSHEHDDFEWVEIEKAADEFENKGFEKDKREAILKAKKYLEMKEAESRWKRCLADLENYKKRTQKSNEEFRKYCLEDFISELLPVLDNFETASKHISYDKSEEGWVAGIMHIKNQLENVLKDKGIEEIKIEKGDEIDANFHEVISGKGEKVFKVLKKGYRMGDRVIRAAVVEAGS